MVCLVVGGGGVGVVTAAAQQLETLVIEGRLSQ